jgi:hypothetical protein
VDEIRRVARAGHLDVLAGVQGDRLVAIVGGAADPLRSTRALVAQFGPGPVVVGPAVPDLLAAGSSAAAAVAGLYAAPAWPDAPRPVPADELLPERALAGDPLARERLVREVSGRCSPPGPPSSRRCRCSWSRRRPLEAPRGRSSSTRTRCATGLRRVTEVSGYAPSDPRQALTLRVALALGRLADARLAAPGVL